ncbi:hypothetical protein STANM309S_05998 [Streptomyces tanashiensis]
MKRAGYEVRIRRHEDIPADEMAELLRKAGRLGGTGPPSADSRWLWAGSATPGTADA